MNFRIQGSEARARWARAGRADRPGILKYLYSCVNRDTTFCGWGWRGPQDVVVEGLLGGGFDEGDFGVGEAIELIDELVDLSVGGFDLAL